MLSCGGQTWKRMERWGPDLGPGALGSGRFSCDKPFVLGLHWGGFGFLHTSHPKGEAQMSATARGA